MATTTNRGSNQRIKLIPTPLRPGTTPSWKTVRRGILHAPGYEGEMAWEMATKECPSTNNQTINQRDSNANSNHELRTGTPRCHTTPTPPGYGGAWRGKRKRDARINNTRYENRYIYLDSVLGGRTLVLLKLGSNLMTTVSTTGFTNGISRRGERASNEETTYA